MISAEMIAVFVLLLIIAALTAFLILRKCAPEQPKSAELETMYDYTPGVPPPKTIPVTGKMSGEQKWSFLWN
jgi:hypothetical protein